MWHKTHGTRPEARPLGCRGSPTKARVSGPAHHPCSFSPVSAPSLQGADNCPLPTAGDQRVMQGRKCFGQQNGHRNGSQGSLRGRSLCSIGLRVLTTYGGKVTITCSLDLQRSQLVSFHKVPSPSISSFPNSSVLPEFLPRGYGFPRKRRNDPERPQMKKGETWGLV